MARGGRSASVRGGRPRRQSVLEARQAAYSEPRTPGATRRPGSSNPRKSWPR